jgi:ATP-dependent Clp endopeptidase proteolytic subunit ClpP
MILQPKGIIMQVIYDIEKGFKVTKIDELLFEPVVVGVGEFTMKALTKYEEDFNKALNTGQSVVPVLINSYGGYVDAVMAMITVIEASPIPVATICTGWAMSCGLCLFSCGTPGMRFMGPNARLMLHEISGGTWGKEKEVTADAKEMKRLNKNLFRKVSKACGHKPNYFMDLMRSKINTDFYLSPKQALRHNIADVIGVPTMTVNAKIKTDFKLNSLVK